MAQCAEDLANRLTPWLISAEFRRMTGLKRIVLSSTLKSRQGWRGEALWREGDIVLDARDCSRYCTASAYSKPDGKADMSPTGVAAHEQGHFLWFADRNCVRPWMQLFRSKVERPITSYAGTSVGEDFAETFRLFSTNPGMLADIAPQRYGLMSDIVQDFYDVLKPASRVNRVLAAQELIAYGDD
jgi:hypothetical protein